MVRSSVLLLLIGPAVLSGASPALAGVAVAPEPVSPAGVVVQDVQVAAGADRTAVLLDTFRGRDRPRDFALLARLYEGRRAGRLVRLPGGGSAGGVDVSVGADGTAVAAWIDDRARRVSALRVAVAERGRPFGDSQTVTEVRTRTAAGLILGGVAVGPTGRAVVTWSGADEATVPPVAVQAAIRRPGGRFGAPVALDGAQGGASAAAAAPWGDLLVGWVRERRPSGADATWAPVALARTLRRAGTRFGAATTLSAPGQAAGRPVGVSGAGGAGVTWRRQPAGAFGAPVTRMLSTATRSGGVITRELPLTIRELDTGLDTLQLALPAGAGVVAVWADMVFTTGAERDLASSIVRTSVQRPDRRTFTPARRLSAADWLASPPAIGELGDGVAVAWSERRGDALRLRYAVRSERGWIAARTIPGARGAEVDAAGAGRRVAVLWADQPRPSGPAGRVRLAWITR